MCISITLEDMNLSQFPACISGRCSEHFFFRATRLDPPWYREGYLAHKCQHGLKVDQACNTIAVPDGGVCPAQKDTHMENLSPGEPYHCWKRCRPGASLILCWWAEVWRCLNWWFFITYPQHAWVDTASSLSACELIGRLFFAAPLEQIKMLCFLK